MVAKHRQVLHPELNPKKALLRKVTDRAIRACSWTEMSDF